MNLRVLQILAVQSIIFSFAFAKIQGIYIGSVPSNVLPPISLHIPQNYNHFVETSAEFAVHALNQELSLQKQSNSSKYPTSLPLVLREVHSEATQIGEGIIVGAWMEFDHGVRYEVKIAVPHQVQPGLLSLPSGEEHHSPISLENPRFEEWKFNGPLEISFSKSRDDIKMRMPRYDTCNAISYHQRDIDTGAIRKIKVEKDVDVKVNGLTSVKLLKPIEVELTSKPSRDGEELELSWKQVPELEFDGNILFQSGIRLRKFSDAIDNRVKVKRVNSLEVKFVNGTENSLKFGITKKPSISLTKENPLTQYLEKVILQTKAISGFPNARLRRIISGRCSISRILIEKATADAVTLVLMPVELLSADGVITNWNMIVTRDANGNHKLFSYEQLQPTNAVSVEPSLTINPNGTFYETLDRFAPFLKAGTQLALE